MPKSLRRLSPLLPADPRTSEWSLFEVWQTRVFFKLSPLWANDEDLWLHFSSQVLPFGQEPRLSNPFWISWDCSCARQDLRYSIFWLKWPMSWVRYPPASLVTEKLKAWFLDLAVWLTTVEVGLLRWLVPQESQMIHIAIDDNSTAIFHQESSLVVEIVFKGWCSIGPIWSGLILRRHRHQKGSGP